MLGGFTEVVVRSAAAAALCISLAPVPAFADPWVSGENHTQNGSASTVVTGDWSEYGYIETEVRIPTDTDLRELPILAVMQEKPGGDPTIWKPIDKNAEIVNGHKHGPDKIVAPDRPEDGAKAIAVELVVKDKNGDRIHDHITVIPHYPLTVEPGGPSYWDPDNPPFIVEIVDPSNPDEPVDPGKIIDNAEIVGGKLDPDGKIVPDPLPDGTPPEWFDLEVEDTNGDGIFDKITVIPHYPIEFEDENKDPIVDVEHKLPEGTPLDHPPAVSKEPEVIGATPDPDTGRWIVPSKNGKVPDWIEVIYEDSEKLSDGNEIWHKVIVIPHYPPDVIGEDGDPIPDVEWVDADGNPTSKPVFPDMEDVTVIGGYINPDGNIVVPDKDGKKPVSAIIKVLEVDENGRAVKIEIIAVWEDEPGEPADPDQEGEGPEEGTKAEGGTSVKMDNLLQTGDTLGLAITGLTAAAFTAIIVVIGAGRRKEETETE